MRFDAKHVYAILPSYVTEIKANVINCFGVQANPKPPHLLCSIHLAHATNIAASILVYTVVPTQVCMYVHYWHHRSIYTWNKKKQLIM